MLLIVRRLSVDLMAMAALLAPFYLGLLPGWTEPVGPFIAPVLVSFGRGVVERRFLREVPLWLSVAEWCLILFMSGVILCIPGPRSDPHDQFWVAFGFFFYAYITPSIVLGVFGFIGGTRYATKKYGI
jgi:hypothetical protein